GLIELQEQRHVEVRLGSDGGAVELLAGGLDCVHGISPASWFIASKSNRQIGDAIFPGSSGSDAVLGGLGTDVLVQRSGCRDIGVSASGVARAQPGNSAPVERPWNLLLTQHGVIVRHGVLEVSL